jgi:hypothetical protein
MASCKDTFAFTFTVFETKYFELNGDKRFTDLLNYNFVTDVILILLYCTKYLNFPHFGRVN